MKKLFTFSMTFALSASMLWAQSTPCANSPRNLSGEYVNNVTQLTWNAPEGSPQWMSWSNGVLYSSVTLGVGVTSRMYHEFEPADLAAYGTVLTKVAFMVNAGAAVANDYSVLVMQVNPDNTIQALAEQSVPDNLIVPGQWIEVTLDDPITIDPARNLLVGYEATQIAAGYPYPYDSNTSAPERGGLGWTENGWLSLAANNMNGAWLIKALMEEAAAAPDAKPAVKSSRTLPARIKAVRNKELKDGTFFIENAYAAPVMRTDDKGNLQPTPADRVKMMSKNTRANETELVPPYYNVYCGGTLIGSTDITTFAHAICNAMKSTYTYEVEYVAAPDCRSDKVSVPVEIQSQALAPEAYVQLAVHPNYPDNNYMVIASVAPVNCATGYVLYQRSKLRGTTQRYELGINATTGNPYTGIYTSFIPGDSTWFSMAALYDFGNGTVESEQSSTIYACLTCLGGAPKVDEALTATNSSGKNVTLVFQPEALTHYVERNGEIIGQTEPLYSYFSERVPDDNTSYTYRIGADCEGLGNMENITWSEPYVYTIPECDVTSELNKTVFLHDEDYFWADGNWVNESGSYVDTLQTAGGCDSIVTLHLTVERVSPVGTFKFYGHKIGWSTPVAVDYAYWEDEQWKPLTDVEAYYPYASAEESDREQYYEFNININYIAHRKAQNDSIIGLRLRAANEENVYTQYTALSDLDETQCYTAANLPANEANWDYDTDRTYSEGKLFMFPCDDADYHKYYASLEGLSGDELRAELTRIVNEQLSVVSYRSLRDAYSVTDLEMEYEQGYLLLHGIWDMYSDYRTQGWGVAANPNGSPEAQALINREHSLPKSWWGHNNANPHTAYSDIMHVIPTNTVVNSMRGAYPYSEVGTAMQTSENGSKMGLSTYSGYTLQAFEPVNEYKGDLARIYFYMAMCYSDLDFTVSPYASAGSAVFTYTNGVSNFTEFGQSLFMKWTEQDPVSNKEVIRNHGVQSIQGNRNPFVDLPGLEDYVWGDKQNQPFYFDSGTVNVETPQAAAPAIYTSERTIYVENIPAGTHVVLYDGIGRTLHTAVADNDQLTLTVPTAGIYVVNLTDKSYKVVVK